MKKVTYTAAHTLNHMILLPDTEIREDKPEYIYVPLRGYPTQLAVFAENPETKLDHPIGWVKTETLGYTDVNAWMAGTKWIDQGY